MAKLVDFFKDDAAQQLLGYAGIIEPYEAVIERECLDILRQSVPACVIERIRFVRSAGSHPAFRAGGTKSPDNTKLITLQELTLPFDLELLVRCGTTRDILQATFVFDCSKLDRLPETEFSLQVHRQSGVDPGSADESP